MNTNYTFAFDTEDKEALYRKTSPKIKIIPIVDANHHLVNVFEYYVNLYVPVATPDLKGNEFTYLVDAFLSTWISSSGKYINTFETEFAKFCETKHGVAVSNGTVALQLALLALGIKEGDEVIVPDLTFAATINAVLHVNATPVIVDVEKDSWCIDPLEIKKAVSPKTKAIIPVHLYGQPCDMDAIMEIANDHNLFIIEDCAEAHGAKYKGKKVGSFGNISCFSFFGNKIITTGEGGICVTNSDMLDQKMRTLRDHGMSKTKRYWHDEIGYNFRMTNLQAAIGVAQLERINEILQNRADIESAYIKVLSKIPCLSFQSGNFTHREKVTWLVCATVSIDRDQLFAALKEEGIDARPFFYPLSEMPIYKKYLYSNKNSIEISKIGLNFPTTENVKIDILTKIETVFQQFN
jgi:perosamine synthetase